MYKKYIKRLLDIILSIVLIILFVPLFIIVGLLCFIVTGKIIFKQNRDGLNKKSFIIYKFSSIKSDRTYSKILNFIRSFGMDELPQLINILKGDMSFIGPRPFITGETLPNDYIDPIIYTIRPGIISLATARGRRRLTHKMRLACDLEYSNNVTFINDVTIIFKTIGILFKQNIHGDGEGQTK